MLSPFCRSIAATPSRSHKAIVPSAGSNSPSPIPPSLAGSDGASSATGNANHALSAKRPKDIFYPSAATSLHPSTTLTYHLITSRLALLAILPTNVYESRRGLVEYNAVFFREGVQEICDAERESRAGG